MSDKAQNRFFACFSLLFIFIFAFNPSARAAEVKDGNEFSAGEMILHHIADEHVWIFTDQLIWYLPVILYSPADGFVTFSSREIFQTGSYGNYVMDHGKIYHVDPDVFVLDISITKNVAQMFISIFILLAVFFLVARNYKKRSIGPPKGIASFFEPIILFIRDDIAKDNIGHKYERFMPYLLTIFFYIWFSNMIGLLPGAANVTGNIAVTGVLAFITLVITQFSGTKHYWAHIFNTPGVPWWLKIPIPIMPLIEMVGIFTKPFALMIRLFANITAGHIIILSLLSLIFIFRTWTLSFLSIPFTVFMSFLELLVALLQAYIFTLLSAIFIGAAVEEHHEPSDKEGAKALV
jgi:F-type H+-transporting ATPase subunit a